VDLPSLQLSAVQAAVAMALAGGSRGLEAVAVLGAADVAAEGDLAVVRDFAGSGVPLLVVATDGTLRATAPS
jgi:acyl CoA:acetate/3-ketoacid CoA transferase beta subunit